MQFSHTHQQGGSKFGKFAIVAALHAALALLFVHGLDTRTMAFPSLPEDLNVTLRPDLVPPPPPPPEPPRLLPQAAPPQLFVPPPEVVTAAAPDPAPLLAATSEPSPRPLAPSVPAPTAAPPAQAAAPAGSIRSAVFADANACALPAYPARALRNGDSGTTTLALLVGVDGRVRSARIERSSGSRELDQAAIHALSLCAFKPAMNDGVPEAGWARLAYVWALD